MANVGNPNAIPSHLTSLFFRAILMARNRTKSVVNAIIFEGRPARFVHPIYG